MTKPEVAMFKVSSIRTHPAGFIGPWLAAALQEQLGRCRAAAQHADLEDVHAPCTILLAALVAHDHSAPRLMRCKQQRRLAVLVVREH